MEGGEIHTHERRSVIRHGWMILRVLGSFLILMIGIVLGASGVMIYYESHLTKMIEGRTDALAHHTKVLQDHTEALQVYAKHREAEQSLRKEIGQKNEDVWGSWPKRTR